MDQESLAALDNAMVGVSIVEIDYLTWGGKLKTAVGVFHGFRRIGRCEWYYVVRGQEIHAEDVRGFREIKRPEFV